jgi:hypothetical protein
MQEEMKKALYKNNTLGLVELVEGKKAIGCKQVFIVKHKAESLVEIQD